MKKIPTVATAFRSRSHLPQHWRMFKESLPIFLTASLALSGFFCLSYSQNRSAEIKILKKTQKQEVDFHKDTIADDIRTIISDLKILANEQELIELFESKNPNLEDIEQEYLDIVRYQDIYDRVRFIDATGKEIVRAEFDGEQPYIVPQKQLQLQAQSDWFKETLALAQDRVFVSQLDLKVENGRLERPFKPMIRFGMPVFDKEGQKRGIVVLNYKAENLLDSLEQDSVKSPGNLMLLNADGFWLKSSNPEDEWGFMLPERKDRTLGNVYPAAWERISQAKSGAFQTSEGLFAFTTIDLLLEADRTQLELSKIGEKSADRLSARLLQWKLVSFVPNSEISAINRRFWQEMRFLYGGLVAFIAVGSGFLAIVRVRRQISEEELHQTQAQLHEFSQREELMKNRLASQIRNSLELSTILENVVRESRELLQLDRCVFGWYRCQTNPPRWEAIVEDNHPDFSSFLNRPPTSGIQPLIEKLKTENFLRIDNIAILEDRQIQHIFESWGYVSAIVLGVQTRAGQWGILVCGNCQTPTKWSELAIETISGIGEQLAIALNQAELYAESRTNAIAAQNQAQQLQKILQDLQRTQAQLIQSEKMSSLGQLVAGVAHEINNPVSFIHGNLTHADEYAKDLLHLLQLYQKHYPNPAAEILEEMEEIDLEFLSEDLLKMLRSMKMGTERIREIVKSLRTFSRLDEAELKDVNLHEGIANTLTILRHRLKAQPNRPAIEVIENYEPLPLVQCYAGQLNQVFMNLIANAIDAVESRFAIDTDPTSGMPATRSPKIRISTTLLPNGWVSIRIADNGNGIPENLQSRLFDPFFTTKPVGKGTGLGLSISYKIVVEQHGGKLECSSIVGRGTKFTIEIPQEQERRLPQPAIPSSQVATDRI